MEVSKKISGRQSILFLIVALVFVIYGCGDGSHEEIKPMLLDDSETVPFPGAGPVIYLSYENQVGMQLGQGYDSVSQNTSQGTCINFNLVPQAGSWETWTIVEVVKSMNELKSSLGVNASASLDIGLYQGSFHSSVLSKIESSSRSIFALAKIKLKGPYITINDPTLKDEIIYKDEWKIQKRSAEEIYDICGDYYLGTIASGGTLIAVIKIEANSQEEKDTITSELDASSMTAKGEVKVKSEFAQTLQKYNAKTQVYAVGCDPISPSTDFDEFMNMVGNFGPDIQECVDNKGVLNAAVVATYFPMSSVIQRAIDEKLDVSEQEKKMNRLIDYYTLYGEKALDIGHIITHPSAYDFTTSPYTLDDLQQLRNDITKYNGYQQIVHDAVTDCTKNPYHCSMPETLPEDKYPENISLPTVKDFNPSDCHEVILKYGAPLYDEYYTVFLGGDINKPFEVYCYGMNTESPKTFLDLPQGDKTNYATFIKYWQWKEHGSKYWPDLTTSYKKIHIIPEQSQITVDICDASFATTSVKSDKKTNQSSSSFPVGFGCPTPLSYVPYGVSIGSYRGIKTPKYPGTADINLTGTPFAIADDATWSYFGTSEVGFINISTDRKTADFGVGGDNGYLKTGIPGRIKLKWVGH